MISFKVKFNRARSSFSPVFCTYYFGPEYKKEWRWIFPQFTCELIIDMGEFSSWWAIIDPICCGLGDEFAEWWWWWCCIPSCDNGCMVVGTWWCDIICMLWWCCGWCAWCVGSEDIVVAPRSMGSILVDIIFSYITGIICSKKNYWILIKVFEYCKE